jgi:integrase
VNRELGCLKTLLAKATAWGHLELNPAASVKRFREPPSRERFLTREEARRLVNVAGPALRPIIIAALGTGMRRGEILALKWADLDFIRGLISITMSKSGKGRKIPMSGAVAEVLSAVPRRCEFVFMNGEPGQSVTSIKSAFGAACAAAKITGFRFHDLRHTFASRALESGADLVSVSKILGHSSIAMTSKYLHGTAEGQRRAAEIMGEFLASTRQNPDTAQVAVTAAQPVAPSRHDN